MSFNWDIFISVFGVGTLLAVLGWYIIRQVEKANDASKLEEARRAIRSYHEEVYQLKLKVLDLERQVNALKNDVDILHDALMRSLQRPPRR